MHTVVIFELRDDDGIAGIGEAAPATTYRETAQTIVNTCQSLDCQNLDFNDTAASTAWLERQSHLSPAMRCGLNIALLDGAAKKANKPVHDLLNLGFRENQHLTSFSIGIDTPDVVHAKVVAAAAYPVLKLKVGVPQDTANIAALREAAPDKPLRVDANEGWETKEQALQRLEQLAKTGNIQFVEQPMPREARRSDLTWLKERSPLPLFADESCLTLRDIPLCAEGFHGVNVKLVKAGGISMAHETLLAARHAGLKTMIGCMIETSVAISAAAHLAELADYLDLDGNLLIRNDPYSGVTAARGILSFANAPLAIGLRVGPRS